MKYDITYKAVKTPEGWSAYVKFPPLNQDGTVAEVIRLGDLRWTWSTAKNGEEVRNRTDAVERAVHQWMAEQATLTPVSDESIILNPALVKLAMAKVVPFLGMSQEYIGIVASATEPVHFRSDGLQMGTIDPSTGTIAPERTPLQTVHGARATWFANEATAQFQQAVLALSNKKAA